MLNRIDFGDKGCHLLLFWGAPQSHENDIERILNFALELRQASQLPICMGVTYRIGHAGFVGSDLREEYTCYGRGVNLAARLMMGATVGNIWLDEPLARRATAFQTSLVGQYQFKGFDKKLPVFSLGRKAEQSVKLFDHRWWVGIKR